MIPHKPVSGTVAVVRTRADAADAGGFRTSTEPPIRHQDGLRTSLMMLNAS